MGRDTEKNVGKVAYSAESSPELPEYGETSIKSRPWKVRFVDSFKRDPNAHAMPKGVVGADGRVFEVEDDSAVVANSPLERRLKGRHLQMIAIGGSIGTHPATSPPLPSRQYQQQPALCLCALQC